MRRSMNNSMRIFAKVLVVVVGMILIVVFGLWLYVSPIVQHPKYEKRQVKELLRLLGPYGQEVKELSCMCYSCSDFGETEHRICHFRARKEVMDNIVNYLKLEKRELGEWEMFYIDKYRKEGFTFVSGLGNNFECMQYAPFTATFTNPQKPYGGLIDIFYNQETGDACVAFQPYGFG